MALFDIQPQQNNSSLGSLIKKSQPKKSHHKQIIKTAGKTLLQQIPYMEQVLLQSLGKHKDEYKVITNKEELKEYLSHYNDVDGIIALDTETTDTGDNNKSVWKDVYKAVLAGVCLYIANQVPVYVPVNHRNYITNERILNQLTEQDIKECLEPYANVAPNVKRAKWIYHNCDFDYRILLHTCNLDLGELYWDTLNVSHQIDENEEHGLKYLHDKYCVNSNYREDLPVQFSKFFGETSIALFSPEYAKLYAAGDPVKTYELYKWQLEWLSRPENKEVLDLCKNIEIPIIPVAIEMEENGMAVDLEYNAKIAEEFEKNVEELKNKVYLEIEKYKDKIQKYIDKYGNVKGKKLDYPINIDAPGQLAILFYDIMGIPPRGTKDAAKKKIKELAYYNPRFKDFFDALLNYRQKTKLHNDFIVKLREYIQSDGKIHCSISPCGVDEDDVDEGGKGVATGRFSCKRPNQQQIPSHEKLIRPQFIASKKDWAIVGEDFSKQEPAVATAICQDEHLLKVFNDGLDIYVMLASKIFNLPYDDCKEFNADGSDNVEGAKRRGIAKVVWLAATYGMGPQTLAENLNLIRKYVEQGFNDKDAERKAFEEADSMIKNMFAGFPGLTNCIKRYKDNCKQYGYVSTLWGKRRHLPDIQLPQFQITLLKDKNGKVIVPSSIEENPLDWTLTDEKEYTDKDIPQRIKDYYLDKLSKTWGKKKIDEVIKEAESVDKIKIINNGAKIAQAERQCFNAVIQGSAGQFTKLALINIYRNQRLRELNYYLLLPVHDEILGECPIENAKEVSQIVQNIMVHAGDEKLKGIKISTDIAISKRWYGEKIKL